MGVANNQLLRLVSQRASDLAVASIVEVGDVGAKLELQLLILAVGPLAGSRSAAPPEVS